MAIVTQKNDGVEITRNTTIAHKSDVTAAERSFKLGYKPTYVQVVNVDDKETLEWYVGMASDSAVKTVAAGTRTLVASAGIKVKGDTISFTDVQNKQFYVRAQG